MLGVGEVAHTTNLVGPPTNPSKVAQTGRQRAIGTIRARLNLLYRAPAPRRFTTLSRRNDRRGVRVVEGDGLENRWALFGSRGFESHPLRRCSMRSSTWQPRVADFAQRSLWPRECQRLVCSCNPGLQTSLSEVCGPEKWDSSSAGPSTQDLVPCTRRAKLDDLERWPSGRRRSPAKRVRGYKPLRGFKSLPLRSLIAPQAAEPAWIRCQPTPGAGRPPMC